MTKNLTEQWKNGELEGEYYIETHDGKHYVCELQTKSGVKNKRLPFAKSFNGYVSNKSVAKVLAPVPSYEEWKNITDTLDYEYKGNLTLREENAKLKELLKECREVAEFTKTIVNKHKWFNEVITKIDKVLK